MSYVNDMSYVKLYKISYINYVSIFMNHVKSNTFSRVYKNEFEKMNVRVILYIKTDLFIT